MSPQHPSSDLIAELFLILRAAFFESEMRSRIYQLRDKRNTQDDPFDEYVYKLLVEQLPHDTRCLKAPGPLITPDLVIMRPHSGRFRVDLRLADEEPLGASGGSYGVARKATRIETLPQGELVFLGCEDAICDVLVVIEGSNRILNCNVVCFEIAHTLI